MGNYQEMTHEEWQIIHNKYETCLMSMVMDHKRGIITSLQLLDLIENYCKECYLIGLNKND